MIRFTQILSCVSALILSIKWIAKAMNKSTYIVIPAKDEASRIGKVILRTQECGFNNIIVVDDGSSDNTAEIVRNCGATLVQHFINLGPGAATQTGIQYAIHLGAKQIVTIDADQQHFPQDITSLVKKLTEEELDIVLGSRFLMGDNKIPYTRIFYNKIANVVSGLATGILVTDSQSGMKAFTASFAKKSKLQYCGFEFCIELIRYIKIHNAKFAEVPIRVMYNKETMDKGQNLFVGLKMLNRIFKLF